MMRSKRIGAALVAVLLISFMLTACKRSSAPASAPAQIAEDARISYLGRFQVLVKQ